MEREWRWKGSRGVGMEVRVGSRRRRSHRELSREEGLEYSLRLGRKQGAEMWGA